MWRPLLLAAVLCSLGWAQTPDPGWGRVGQLASGDRVQVFPRSGDMLSGRFVDSSPSAIRISSGRNNIRSIPSENVKTILVRRKASRWKTAGISAAVGFAAMFAVGAASAGYVTDTNNPTASDRVGAGAGFGMVGAGVGFALGAALGGSQYETVYPPK